MKIVKNNQTAKDTGHIIVNTNEIIKNVKEFVYLRTLITNNYDDTKEIRRRLCMKFNGLINKHLEDSSIIVTTKKKLLHTVFGIAHNGSEFWVVD